MDILAPVVASVAPCAGAFGLGWALRRSVCDDTDCEVRSTHIEEP